MSHRILVAEDDKDVRELLALYLQKNGYEVFTASNGREAIAVIENQAIAMALVDLMMPELNGYELMQNIRTKYRIPIIVISARTDKEDKLRSYTIGADAYITKPFNIEEVIAQVNALIRRVYKLDNQSEKEKDYELLCRDLRINLETFQIYKAEVPVQATATQARILIYLIRNKNHIVTTQQIAEAINGVYLEGDYNGIQVQISRIRSKLESNDPNAAYIKTIRGLGYVFCEE